MMPIGDVAPELALAIGACVVLVVVLFVPRTLHWIGAPIAALAAVVAVVLAARLHVSVPPKTTFSGTWALDGFTAWTTYIACASTVFVAVLSPRWFATDARHGEWYTILLLCALGAILIAGAADSLELMVGMLLVSVTGYTLASYHRASKMCAEAGAKYFFLGALTNPILLFGITVLYGLSATTLYSENVTIGDAPIAMTAAVGAVLVGLAFELGAFPVHPWVPDVAQGSPAPGAAFLTVVPKVGALIAIARFVSFLPEAEVAWRPLVAVMALLTMTVGNLAALWQTDVRRLIGWSSVSQAGYGLLAVVALGRSPLAEPSLVLFAIGYALANLTAFAVVVDLRGRTALGDYDGLARTRPWHAFALVVAFLSLTGIPPLVGFGAKVALFGAAIDAGYTWLALAAVINTVVSIFYYLRVIAPMFTAPPPDRPVATLGREVAALAVLGALATLAFGLGAEVVLGSIDAGSVVSG